MIQNPNGYRYNDNRLWSHKLHQPYDYANEGLNRRIMSHKIYNTKNTILHQFLTYYESCIIFILKYIDVLHHYKNYLWKNR